MLEEQMLIERTYVSIEEQLKTFEREFLLRSKTNVDSLRQSFEQIQTQLNSMEKSHSHLFSASSSTDTTIIERSQQFKSSVEKKFDEFFRFEYFSNQIDVEEENLRILIETSNIRLQSFHDEEQKSETFIQRAQTAFQTFRSRCVEMIEKIREEETKLKNETFAKDFHSILNERFRRFIVRRCDFLLSLAFHCFLFNRTTAKR